MELNITVETSESCYFNIKDSTCGDSGYLPESSSSVEINRFKYSDTIGIARLTLNKTDQQIDLDTIFIPHIAHPKYITIPTQFDGWFTLNYVVIPTKDWFDRSQDQLDFYSTVYYSDGISIYKYINNESTKIEFSELVERNPQNTTISISVNEFTSICFLKKCFISLCKQIFDLRGFSKCKIKGNVDSNLIYNRDLVWMTINIISYLTEFGQLAEAQRLIEQIEQNCNGLCKFEYRGTTWDRCGCS